MTALDRLAVHALGDHGRLDVEHDPVGRQVFHAAHFDPEPCRASGSFSDEKVSA